MQNVEFASITFNNFEIGPPSLSELTWTFPTLEKAYPNSNHFISFSFDASKNVTKYMQKWTMLSSKL